MADRLQVYGMSYLRFSISRVRYGVGGETPRPMLTFFGNLRPGFEELARDRDATQEDLRRFKTTVGLRQLAGLLAGLLLAGWLCPGIDLGDWFSLRALFYLTAAGVSLGVGLALNYRAYRRLRRVVEQLQAGTESLGAAKGQGG